MKKVFLDDLPRKNNGKGKNIDWKNSVGYKVHFIYEDIDGYIEILDYIDCKLNIKYNNKELKINTSNFIKVNIGKILNNKNKKYTTNKHKVYGIIYKIRNKINNKIYIGQTKHSFKERYKNNLRKNTHNIELKNDIEKYGIDNFEIDEFFDIAYSKEELDKLEQLYIKSYNLLDSRYGYNKTLDFKSIPIDYDNYINNDNLIYDIKENKIFNSISELSKYCNISSNIIGYSLNNFYNPYVERIKYRWIYLKDLKIALDEYFKFNIDLDYVLYDSQQCKENNNNKFQPVNKDSYKYTHL